MTVPAVAMEAGAERRRVERAVNRARMGGALVACLVGPFFANLGIGFVVGLGALLLGYAITVQWLLDRVVAERAQLRLARISVSVDLLVVVLAMLIFSPDGPWTTFILGVLVVITGAFRLGTFGGFLGAAILSVAYIGLSLFRQAQFGYVVEPQRVVFHISVYFLTALLLGGILRELHALRAEREAVVRQVAAADALRRSAVRLQALRDAALDAVVVMDGEGRITEWNPQAVALFGWSQSEAIGRILAQTIVPPRYRGPHTAGLARYLETGEGPVVNRRIEIEAVRRDGSEFPVELMVLPLREGTDHIFTAFIRDLTERHRAEEAARRQLVAEEASVARSELLARASHELRTPLNAILGFAGLLDEQIGPGLADRQRRYLRNIRDSGDRLLRVVTGILDLAQADTDQTPSQRAQIELATLFEPIVAAARAVAEGRDVAFTATVDPGFVLLDSARLRPAVTALLDYAVAVTPPGGSVTLRSGLRDRALEIAVGDGGVPIPVEQREGLFDEFLRWSESTMGSGTELALCRRLIELQGGTVSLLSAPGTANVFGVRLADVGTTLVTGDRLLIVDDESADAELIVALAESAGLRSEVVGSAAAALEACRRDPPRAVVLDLHLPDGHGHDLLRELRADPQATETRIIVIAAQKDDGTSVALGADAHLMKPLDRARFGEWLRSVADRDVRPSR